MYDIENSLWEMPSHHSISMLLLLRPVLAYQRKKFFVYQWESFSAQQFRQSNFPVARNLPQGNTMSRLISRHLRSYRITLLKLVSSNGNLYQIKMYLNNAIFYVPYPIKKGLMIQTVSSSHSWWYGLFCKKIVIFIFFLSTYCINIWYLIQSSICVSVSMVCRHVPTNSS